MALQQSLEAAGVGPAPAAFGGDAKILADLGSLGDAGAVAGFVIEMDQAEIELRALAPFET